MMRKTFMIVAAMMLFVVTMWARPALKGTVCVKQPDGRMVTLQLHGDEFMHFTTTADGYTVVRSSDGCYRYAVEHDGLLQTTEFAAADPAERQAPELAFLATQPRMVRPAMTEGQRMLKESAATLYAGDQMQRRSPAASKIGRKHIDYGNFKGLVLLVEFNDRKFLREDAQEFYQRLTSEKNMDCYYDVTGTKRTEVYGSVRDYFRDNSMGIFDPTFDVVGPVQVNYNATYAGGQNGNKSIYNILKAALSAANSQVDYSVYDLDGDNKVDMVYFIFAGYGSYVAGNNTNYIWPHAADFSYFFAYGSNSLRFDGVKFGRYACSVEIQDYESQAAEHQDLDGIGTMCHEFSHVLGLADHYDTDYEQNGSTRTPEGWDVMASGADYLHGLSPIGYSAYERYSLGFAPLQKLDVAGNYTLAPFQTNNQFYLLETGTRNENFYIENRQREGWDRALPGHGMLVWRVDSTNTMVWQGNSVNANTAHMYLELISAIPGKGMSTGYTPFPGLGNVGDFTATTSPALKTWAGKEAVLDLYYITETSDGLIYFKADKNLFENTVEDFEAMEATTADAENVQGKFCQWTLSKVTVDNVEGDVKGNGQHVAHFQRSGTMASSVIEKPVRSLSFRVWTGGQQMKVVLKALQNGVWTTVKNASGQQQTTISKNSETVVQYVEAIPAGCQLQIQALGTSASAELFLDDLSITFGSDVGEDGIATVNTPATATDAQYSLSGQRVTDGYRGIVISNGRKMLVR